MKNLLVIIALVLAGVAAFGFYRDWFQVSTADAGHKPTVTFSVDRDKMRDDERTLKGVGRSGTAPTDRTGEPDRLP